MAVRLKSYLRKSRHEVYYFRRAVPTALVHRFDRKEIYVSLRTGDRREAEKRALPLYLRTEHAFEAVRRMGRKKGDVFSTELVLTQRALRSDGTVESETILDISPEEALAHPDLVRQFIPNRGQPVSGPAPDSHPAIKLSELFQRYCKAQTTWAPASRKCIEGDLAQIAQVAGDPLVVHLTKPLLAELQETLQKLPANVNKNPALRGKSIEEILRLGLPAQSASSVKKKWGHLCAAMKWGLDRGLVSNNDAKAMRVKAAAESYEKFSDEDLEKLFCNEPVRAGFDEAFKYWAPLIGLFTGARLNEICQLRLSDVSEVEGVLCFQITEAENDADVAARRAKKLKAGRESARTIPVHPSIIQLGLREYLAELRAEGHYRLFPELRDNVKGSISARASEWFTGYRRRLGVGAPTGKSTKAFHSFRHTANHKLQKAGVPTEIREHLLGHRPSAKMNVGVYGGAYPMKLLEEYMLKLQYPVPFVPFRASERQRKARAMFIPRTGYATW